MRIVFRSVNLAEAYRIRGLLEAHGIPAVVENEILSSVRGEVPLDMTTMPVVRIADETQADDAERIIAGEAAPAEGPPWRCQECGTMHEAAFTACWSCGAERPG